MSSLLFDGEFNNKIVQGEIREVLRGLPPSFKADCVVTSPPYWKHREYTYLEGELGHENTYGEYIQKLTGIFRDITWHMQSSGSLWVNIGDTVVDGKFQMIPWRFALEMEKHGFKVRNVVIWFKPDGMAESCTRRFSQKYEPFFWFTPFDDYYFNYEAATIPCKVSTVERLESKFYSNKGSDVSRMAGLIGDMSHKVDEYLERGVNATDCWPINTNKERVEHSAPYPVELVVRPIVATCPPGGLVFDPFMGSGTTALATARMGEGRRYFGVDIDEQAVLEARGRVKEETAQGKLF